MILKAASVKPPMMSEAILLMTTPETSAPQGLM